MISTSLVSNTIQPMYSKKLLGKAVQLTKLVDTAQLEELPANNGNTSVRFYRPPAADLTATGAPAALTEATVPSNYRTIGYTAIDVTLVQRGQVSRVSDVANNVGLIKYLDSAIDLMGEEFALDFDTQLRNVLCHASTGLTKRYAQSLANFAGLASATAANGKLICRDLLDSMTQLTITRASTFGGKFVAVLPPQAIRDLFNDAEFREVVRNNNAEKIFNGEIGEYYGCKIVAATNPFQEDETEGTFATSFSGAGSNTTGFIYTSIITGKGAYGNVNMKKMGASPMKPQLIINDKPDSGNPLAQWITVGWKAYNANVVLNSSWGLALRSKTQYV